MEQSGRGTSLLSLITLQGQPVLICPIWHVTAFWNARERAMLSQTREKNVLNTLTPWDAVLSIALSAWKRKQITLFVLSADMRYPKRKQGYSPKRKISFLRFTPGFIALNAGNKYSTKRKHFYSESERRTKNEKRIGNKASRMDCTYRVDWHCYLFYFLSRQTQKRKERIKEKGTMEFVTIKELSKFLKVKESTLYSWVHHGLIPFHKLNGLVRFDMEEIKEWIKVSHKETQNRELYIVKKQPQDIDSIVKKAIDSAKVKEYNSSNGKPGQIKVSGGRFHGTV